MVKEEEEEDDVYYDDDDYDAFVRRTESCLTLNLLHTLIPLNLPDLT